MAFDVNKVVESLAEQTGDVVKTGGMKYEDAKLTKSDFIRFGLFPAGVVFVLYFLYASMNGAAGEGFVKGLIFGIIVAAIALYFRMHGKHERAERAFLDGLKASGEEPVIERLALPRDGKGDVVVYAEGYGEFWRYRSCGYDEYVTDGQIINNEIVLTYEHRDKDGNVKGYDTIRTLNAYKEVISETH